MFLIKKLLLIKLLLLYFQEQLKDIWFSFAIKKVIILVIH